jgi:phosphatidylserine/phosphatidylglycerophosphate/cardiolipin synthase-like enzyme
VTRGSIPGIADQTPHRYNLPASHAPPAYRLRINIMPRFRLISVFAALVALLLTVLYGLFQTSRPTDDGSLPLDSSGAQVLLEVFFSEPDNPSSSSLRGGPDSLLAQSIDEARYSVDVALYSLNLWSVRDALLRAHRRGVAVRMVTESDNILEREIDELEQAGIPVLGDRREPLMHHKFVVIDRMEVWTGSMNMTMNGAYRNDNNLVRVRSVALAENYTHEFEEMFVEDRFGALSLRDTPQPSLNLDGMLVQIYFSPDDDPAARIIELLLAAEHSIDFMVFAFTADEITDAMLDRAQDGVIVRGVIERGQASNQGSEYETLRQSVIDVRLDANQHNMHHKVIVIDGEIVITGSYNFSRNAQEFNDENVLVLHNAVVASQFLIEFERIFNAAQH